MAATAATATTSIYGRRDFRTVALVPKTGFVNIRRIARSKICICSSSEDDDISTTTTTTKETEEKEEETTVEVQDEPQSFISALNVEKAMRGIRIYFYSLCSCYFLYVLSWKLLG